ncbi:MAG: menaquinone-dependent protoporphyrinogen IX dehydrogenase [Zoogloeaceae bacterium]|jgi:menaquinone-dependent protoporphyrinogen oxidase|nr:menaquinone-dependent protoporphyrinogen IX dehydrogenase [Zoogloeaceae bacterium]
MATILILYSTVDGHTRTICERIGRVVEAAGHSVTLRRMEEADGVNPADYDRIVIGASIRYGKHRPSVFEFIRKYHALLESRPNALFSVNIVARKPEKNRPETNPYFRKFLRQIRWKPQLVEVFAGRLDYPSYRPLDRLAIRFIMWITRGPTDPNAVIEFTDWTRVDEFARKIAALQAGQNSSDEVKS